ncbi:MAG: response regulator [Candidatus Thiodiazotropha sp. (ex. Lucinisca nassula)]|nr:response regulator [Candidatus Thiodiazotropha sp. (ex. Lucinisca nassula)]
MRILIVDDDRDARDAFEIILTSQGYEVFSAKNGNEALNLLHHSAVDAVVSDIMMPEMDGFELCRQLKMDNKLNTIPFIFITAT